MFRFFIFFQVVCVIASASEFSAELYSENSYLSREAAAISSVRVRASRPLTAFISPYLQVGNELATTSGEVTSVESESSFAYLAPGVALSLGPLNLYTEFRFRQFYRELDTPPEGQGPTDFRSVLVYGNYFAKRISPTLSTDLFSEIYSEAVFTSADLNNVVATGFGRFGARISPFANGYVDLFLETYATIDRLGHYYYRHADLRPSLRMQYATTNLTVSLSAAYMLSYFYPTATYEDNPYKNQAGSMRVMLVVGGTL